MPKFDSSLNNIKIASPCQADWNEMYGNDRKRFCADCKLNVYNLSGMTRDEAESLITNAEGRLCVRYYKRADGTVITEDCPVGWARVKQRTKVIATATLSLLIAMVSGVFSVSLFSRQGNIVGKLVPFATPTPQRLMGVMAIPPKNTNSNSYAVQGDVDRPTPTPKTRSSFEMGKMKVLAGQNISPRTS